MRGLCGLCRLRDDRDLSVRPVESKASVAVGREDDDASFLKSSPAFDRSRCARPGDVVRDVQVLVVVEENEALRGDARVAGEQQRDGRRVSGVTEIT